MTHNHFSPPHSAKLFATTVAFTINYLYCILLLYLGLFYYTRFEAGTPAIGEAIGLGAAIDYLSGIGMQAIHEYEVSLASVLLTIKKTRVIHRKSDTLIFEI